MRVMLINSPWVHDGKRYAVKAGARWAHIRTRKKTIPYFPFPFSMAYATALLGKKGFKARLLDAVALELDTESTINEVKEFSPDITVVETSTPSIETDLSFVRQLDTRIDTTFIYSGPHASALPDDVLNQAPGLAVLRGEYDYTLLELAKKISENGSLSDVNGISWRDGSNIRTNPNRPLITDLDELPYPVRDELPMNKYTDPSCKKFPNVSILTSRGCPHRCVFCLESTVFNHSPSFRPRDPGKIVDEMQYVIDRFKAKEIYFDDSSFTASIKHAESVASAIIDRGLKVDWSCMADARIGFDTLKLLKDAGCSGLKFGVETADQELMGKINKNLDLDQVREFADNCRKLGLYTHGTFMFGLPYETKQSLERTLEFAFGLQCTTSQFSVATPFPGTEFFKMAQEHNWLVTTEWAKFDGGGSPVVSYPGCSKQDIINTLEKAKKMKIARLIWHPSIMAQYVWKLYKIKGLKGLMSEIFGKLGYLMERSP